MRNWIVILFGILVIPVWGQQPYFQQEVDYRISARLDDVPHMLSGEVTVTYTNHSPDSLSFLYFHLWANAFRDQTTAFSEQKIRMRSTRFYFAKESDLGFYESVDFLANGEPLSWSLDPENPDIARVELPQPIDPEGQIILVVPFQLKVPASFSRLGHVGQSYQFTQWYPKPAVYDREGWHAMPYLDMGEFYSEFGSFDVTLTLPANYVVAATGVLQTESEKQFLRDKVAETQKWLETDPPEKVDSKTMNKRDTFPPSSSEWKTIRYTAERVHDFAWFADKRFHVLDGEVELASGRSVDTWAFFSYAESWLWKDAISYINRAVRFYSDCVGEYPYPHATAVMSALSAGGGMEYPMITVIGTSGDAKALDGVITHEVGHNWFYGILASNERDHPWMDEGINTYYEHRYTETYYGKELLEEMLPKFLTKGIDYSIGELGYLLQARRHRDQAPDTNSNEFKDLNYWLGAYEKPGKAFRHLEGYLGREAYDRAMQAYFREWQFRHPQPNDLKQVLEQETGKSLDWLFEGYLFSNEKMDYALSGIHDEGANLEVKVKNEGFRECKPSPSRQVITSNWYSTRTTTCLIFIERIIRSGPRDCFRNPRRPPSD
ncbi:MAG: M1 family metallopeptidase [Saprospirales bacterium]|nr:M1 family metallopeptidase [Saprospirales bacterium]